jgi:hypothetical protein
MLEEMLVYQGLILVQVAEAQALLELEELVELLQEELLVEDLLVQVLLDVMVIKMVALELLLEEEVGVLQEI